MGSRTAFGFVAALSGFALSSAALADAPLSSSNLFDYEARAGVSYSDNVTRTPGRDFNSVASVLGGRLQARRPEGRLRYDAAGDLSYYRYLKSAVGGQLFGGIKGNAIYDILADSVSWGAQASYNQIKQDLQRPVALGNLEDVISLSTGPTFRVRLGSTLEASLEGRFALTDFSKRSFDNQTVGGKFIIAKRLSPSSLVGLGGSAFWRVSVKLIFQNPVAIKSEDRKSVV